MLQLPATNQCKGSEITDAWNNWRGYLAGQAVGLGRGCFYRPDQPGWLGTGVLDFRPVSLTMAAEWLPSLQFFFSGRWLLLLAIITECEVKWLRPLFWYSRIQRFICQKFVFRWELDFNSLCVQYGSSLSNALCSWMLWNLRLKPNYLPIIAIWQTCLN